MAEVILMPRLSDTMTEGVIAAWHKKVGDTVKKGDLLAEIETDKATMELESYQQGVLLHVGTPRGGKLQVNDLLAIIGTAGEDVAALVAQNTPTSSTSITTAPENTKVETTATAEVASSNTIDVSKMDEVVLMPRLSDTMTEGVIARWQKNVGDVVKKGEILADIETDKATMELESYKDGILLYQGANAGEKILVNQLLCIIGQQGLDIDSIVKSAKNLSDSPAAASSVEQESKAVTSPAPTPAPVVAAPALPTTTVVNEGRIFASPLAKKIAKEKGVDLKFVKGSGEHGRITKTDLDNYTPSSANTFTASAPIGRVSFEDTPVSQMRKVIAKRLSESLFTAPHFYLTMKINMDAVVEARAMVNETSPVKISFN
ncbi:MAG: biotin/lipoyl-containing protein, partial [Sediminibacterium sp.]